ncbi:hypothetical protein ACHAXR_003036 [Thalassiosira sp. AJA248-18]
MQLRDEGEAGCQGIISYAEYNPPKWAMRPVLLCSKPVFYLTFALVLLVGFMNDVFVERVGLRDLQGQGESLPRMLSLPSDEEPIGNGGDGPTFVFVMGIEGTGHHFISSLLAQSPNMQKMKKIGVCSSVGELNTLASQFFGMGKETNLFNPKRRHKEMLDAGQHYETAVDTLITISQKFIEQQKQEQNSLATTSPSSLPFHIAINANSCGRQSMMSYPNYHGVDRPLQNFNLDVFYSMCSSAKVKCKHVFIYRDPYDVIKSTTISRALNKNTYDAIQLYTSVLHLIHSQMASHLDRNLGCFGFLDHKGFHLQRDWERFGNLFGWESYDSFMAHAEKIQQKTPKAMPEETREDLVPSRLMVLMKAFVAIHNRVNGLCYSSLHSMEDQTVSMMKPDEETTIGE